MHWISLVAPFRLDRLSNRRLRTSDPGTSTSSELPVARRWPPVHHPALRNPTGAAPMHDIVIRGGTIIDGTGQAAFTGDVAPAAGAFVLAWRHHRDVRQLRRGFRAGEETSSRRADGSDGGRRGDSQ